MINVKTFGAVGDSSTDNTAALQNAVNSLYATGGEIYFPTGNYYFGENAAINTVALIIATAGISLIGERPSGGSAQGVTLTLSISSAVDGIHVVAPHFKMSNITLCGPTPSVTSPYTLLTFLQSSGNCVIEDCSIQDGYDHVLIASCQNVIFSRCQFRDIYAPTGTPVSNFHLHMIGTPLAGAGSVTLRDCNFSGGSTTGASLDGTTAIIMDEYTQALTLDNTSVDDGGNAFRAQVSSPGGQWPNGIRMKGFGIDQIDGQAIWLAQAQNVLMINCPIEGGDHALSLPGYSSLEIDATVTNLLAANGSFTGAVQSGVSIAGRNVGIFNCATANNSRLSSPPSPPPPPPPPVTYYPQIEVAATAENVAIVGGQCGPLGKGLNFANYGVEVDQGATRVRVLGLDLSQNPLSYMTDLGGSFDFVNIAGAYVYDGETRVAADNLQTPDHSYDLLAADFYITVNVPQAVSGDIMTGSYPLAIIGNQGFWVIGVACAFAGSGSSHSCTLEVKVGSASPIWSTMISTNGNSYSALSPPALIGGSTATQELVLDITAASNVTSLLVTLSCQSIS